jgi:hypothetical protein
MTIINTICNELLYTYCSYVGRLTPMNLSLEIYCASCGELALGAVSLPCCEQAICSQCSEKPNKSNSECPVCGDVKTYASKECSPALLIREKIRLHAEGIVYSGEEQIEASPSGQATVDELEEGEIIENDVDEASNQESYTIKYDSLRLLPG